MKCRIFEIQVADWQASRLPESISEQMAAHQQSCERCSRIAASEAALRRRFNAWAEPAQPSDIWPRLAGRLEQKAPRPLFRISYQWAFAGAMAMAVPLLLWTTIRPQPSVPAMPPIVQVANITRPGPAPTVTDASITTFAVDLLGGAGQSDASIDDPLGPSTSMEHIWTHVHTDMKQHAAD
jgi:hypothetical protein